MTSAFSNRFKAIVDSSLDAIFSKSLDGVITSWNKAAEKIFGFSRDEVLGTPMLNLIPDHLKTEESYILKSIRAGKNITHFRTQRLHKNGSLIELSVAISPVHSDSGEVLEASVIARDIGSRVQIETELNLYKAMVQSSDDAILSEDLNGNVLTWNSAAERIFGYSREEMVGASVAKLIPTHNIDEELALMQLVREGKSVRHYRCERIRKDGQKIYTSISLSPVTDKNGNLMGFSKIARDVSTEVRTELTVAHKACHDPLTGVFNREGIMTELKESIETAQSDNRKFSVLFMDVDGFKTFNDNYGHDFGDQVLTEIANAICSTVRITDSVGRLGGDEFVVCLNGTSALYDLELAITRIKQAVSTIKKINDVKLDIRLSIGVSRYPEDGEDGMKLLKNADSAMYSAKDNGKGQHIYYSAKS